MLIEFYLLLFSWSVRSELSIPFNPTVRTPHKIFLYNYTLPPYTLPEDESDIAIKREVTRFHNAIAETSDYKYLVRNSKIFVDTSLFIKEILSIGRRKLTIICPPRWGKTLNLKMLQSFLELPVDDDGNTIPKENTFAYKLFVNGEVDIRDGDTTRVEKLQNPLLVSKHEKLINKYLATYPVIYVTFDLTIGDNCTEIKRKMIKAISNAYRDHLYLIKILERKFQSTQQYYPNNVNEDLIKYNDFLHERATDNANISLGIKLLVDLLHDHFRQNVFVLFDNYDTPLHNFIDLKLLKYPDSDIREMLFLLFFIGENLYKHPNIHSIITTGNFLIGPPWQHHETSFIVYECGPLREYFGFSRPIVKSLIEKHQIPSHLAILAHKWYNGFQSNFSILPYYNPSSIVRFLNRRNIDVYLKISERDRNFVRDSLRQKLAFFIKRELLLTISKENLTVDERIELSFDTLTTLRRMYTEDKFKYAGSTWFFSYLLMKGYLFKLPESSPDEFRLVQATLPNLETSFVMAQWMIEFYKYEFHIDEVLLQRAAAYFHEYLGSASPSKERLLAELLPLYKHSAGEMNKVTNNWGKYIKRIEEDAAHAILNCVALRLQCVTHFKYEVYYNRVKNSDIVIVNEDHSFGTAFQIAYNVPSSPQQLIDESQNATLAMTIDREHSKLRKILFVGIKIDVNASNIQIASKMVYNHNPNR